MKTTITNKRAGDLRRWLVHTQGTLASNIKHHDPNDPFTVQMIYEATCVADLLAVLDDYAERIDTKETNAGAAVTGGADAIMSAAGSSPVPGPTDAESWVRKETEIALDALNQLESPGPTDADERALGRMGDCVTYAEIGRYQSEEWDYVELKKVTAEDEAALAHLRSRLAAPRVSVTREWADRFAGLWDETGYCDTWGEAVAMLKDIGVSVESGEEGKP